MSNLTNFRQYEIEHLNTLGEISSECTLFLKRDNDDFPIDPMKVRKIGLYGSGVRHTIFGGTGSSFIDQHVFENIENKFIQNAIKITSTKWLDEFDKAYKSKEEAFIGKVKREARKQKISPAAYAVGREMEQFEFDSAGLLNSDDVAIYVLSRISGEGHDRKPIKGDFLLTDSEARDILWLNEHCKKFLLVINSASPVDLTPVVRNVKNILLLSQLGALTSEVLFSILIGETYPSGKLACTWDAYHHYPSQVFGDMNDTQYTEGLFVGYRYFATRKMKPLFPFGFGLGYTKFSITLLEVKNEGEEFTVTATVKNIGDRKGKEVVQLYLSKPSYVDFLNPRYELAAFAKSCELEPNDEEIVYLTFKLSDFPSFEPDLDAYNLMSGIYLISIGNSSESLKTVASIEIKKEIVLKKVKHIDQPEGLKENAIEWFASGYEKQAINIELTEKDFTPLDTVEYGLYEENRSDVVTRLKRNQLPLLSLGNILSGLDGTVGYPCVSVMGAAGETTRELPTIKNSLVLADGPCGLRLTKVCFKDKNEKIFRLGIDPLWQTLSHYVPSFFFEMINPEKNYKKGGLIYHQYTSALPVPSALANSFNENVLFRCGELVKSEMERFGVDIWLAPAINIIRNPLCGRNFEYYSEDPYLTSICAKFMIDGVQATSINKKVCIKHFCCNNQETNRMNSNSVVGVRALREIYLSAFNYVIRYARPYAVMTSYNLVNGEHVSESSLFVNDILRMEMRFSGLVMSDWISTGYKPYKKSKYPSISASKEIKAGVNLIMPGNAKDIKDINKAWKKGELVRDDLVRNATIVYNRIIDLKGE